MAIDIENPGADEAELRAALQGLVIPAPDEETDATYTFELADAFKTKVFNRGSAQAITIPKNSVVAFPIGTRIRCVRKGAGLPTISPVDGDVTLRKPTGIKPNRFMGVLCKKAADQTTANYSTITDVAWDGADDHDTDGFHDPASDNDRIIIPSGLGIKKVAAYSTIRADLSSALSDIWLWIRKDGGTYPGMGAMSHEQSSITSVITSVRTGDIAVADTNFFEVQYQNSDTSVTILASNSHFGLSVVEIDPVGSIAYQYGYVTIEKIGTDEWMIEGPALG